MVVVELNGQLVQKPPDAVQYIPNGMYPCTPDSILKPSDVNCYLVMRRHASFSLDQASQNRMNSTVCGVSCTVTTGVSNQCQLTAIVETQSTSSQAACDLNSVRSTARHSAADRICARL